MTRALQLEKTSQISKQQSRNISVLNRKAVALQTRPARSWQTPGFWHIPAQVKCTFSAPATHWPLLLELQTLTCRTCRADVHNVAVGHKDAVKLLFSFGVASKIDSSGGRKEEKQCNTDNIKLDNYCSLPRPLKTELCLKRPPHEHFHLHGHRGVCFLSSLTIQGHSLTWHPQGGNMLLWEAAGCCRVRCMEKQRIQGPAAKVTWTETGFLLLPGGTSHLPGQRPEREFTSPQAPS